MAEAGEVLGMSERQFRRYRDRCVHQYPDGRLAVFHGPRCIARYSKQGAEIVSGPTTRSVTPCSPFVKAWPINTGARRPSTATAILDGVCARRQPETAGRDEETASRSNKETDQQESSDHRLKGLRLAKPHQSVHRFRPGPIEQTMKRTIDVLPKPDILKSYRQLAVSLGGTELPACRRA